MKLSDREWREFYIGDLFLVRRPNARNKDFYEEGEVPFVASGSTNNGVMKCCKAQEDETLDKGRCITVSPVDGSAFYQPYSFLGRGGAGSSILMLYKQDLNLYIGQFIAKMIANTCMSKYTYGHMGNKDSIKRERIMLPINDDDEPDYRFMEDYIKELMAAKRKQYQNYVEKRLAELNIERSGGYEQYLDKKDWQDFEVPYVFHEIQRGKRLKNADHIFGVTPYVSSTANNNGVDDYIEAIEGTRVFKQCISLANSGSVGTAFYEPFEFVASDHVTSLKRRNTGKYVYLFLTSLLKQQALNFNFNREINDLRIKKMKIMLPVNNDKEPDYEFMEAYGRRMMAKKYLQYLHYLAKIIAKEALD